ncbi:nucleoside hydrolase [Paenibacillus sp. FJAT-26967]|uniref:nucleoside hydrolase n=1 Tax=Paenibacillus sp. FJAT-26967 TaxID=1729690 RepID=UPI000838370A|nr:nucleoside hydrolase [Paenibacillus sp. FJAT-26967]
MEQVKHILMDVDTGVDDALALIFAVKSNRLHIEGITTVFGNVDVKQATDNTLRVLELVQPRYEIPVAMGADAPLFRPRRENVTAIHGANGLAGYELPESRQLPVDEKASDFIVRKVREQAHDITLVFTGRLTNLAVALAKDPSIAQKAKLVLMGGAIKVPGNTTPVSEANIHGDPEAAHRVFESGIPIVMVGLDVTSKAKFSQAHYHELMNGFTDEQAELQAFLHHMFTFSFEASERLNEGKYRLMHDPLALAVAENASLVEMEDYYVYIETKGPVSSGATLVDLRHPQTRTNASVCMQVREEEFLQHYIRTVLS